MEETKTYRIGDETFYQAKLGLYQAVCILDLLEAQKAQGVVDAPAFLKLLGNKVSDFLGIVLIPQGMTRKAFNKALKDSGIPEDRRELFLTEADFDLPLEVAEDFFTSSQISSVWNRCVTLGMELLQPILNARSAGNGSSPASVSSLEMATPASGMTSGH